MKNGPRRKALLLARELIAKKKEFYICHALMSVAANNPHLGHVTIGLRFEISRALDYHSSLGGWQRAHGFARSDTQRHLDRLAWIDWILENWE